jgi:hypothetical protein
MSGRGMFFTAGLAVITLDTAESLADRYGNFRRCGSPGAKEAMRNVDHMALFAADAGVKRRLKQISRLTLKHEDPVFKMTFVELDITDHTVEQMGHEMEVVSHGVGPFYLVKEIQLVQKGLDL